MGNIQASLSRKNFLKLTGVAGLAASLPRCFSLNEDFSITWPVLSLRQLPDSMRAILPLVPRLELDEQGFMKTKDDHRSDEFIPVARTQWNLEHSNRWDRLDDEAEWGIVLHWYGDDLGFDQTVGGYLRGFNELRQVDNYLTRTSAHFLIGSVSPVPDIGGDQAKVSILQTQLADANGTPFTASHLKPLDYKLHQERGQYFVRALYELGYSEPTIHSVLQDWFDGRRVDANQRSLAIELTGCYFDDPGHSPSTQQIANTLGIVWALMRRYSIKASSLLGHHEVSLDKSDPGKRFMALVRCLLGAKALVENDSVMNELVFGQHLSLDQDPISAARIYFQWVRDYLVLVSQPNQVRSWEEESGYWFLYDQIFADSISTRRPSTDPIFGPASSWNHPAGFQPHKE
jgi:hypothetical protein